MASLRTLKRGTSQWDRMQKQGYEEGPCPACGDSNYQPLVQHAGQFVCRQCASDRMGFGREGLEFQLGVVSQATPTFSPEE